MRVYLKIKVKSLAEEAKIIRNEERKYKGESPEFQGLHLHRINDVRKESRSANLAYGFLKGRSYSQIEHPNSRRPDWDRVYNLIKKYNTTIDKDELHNKFKSWAIA